MKPEALERAIRYMFEDLKIIESDVEMIMEDEEKIAIIPYYAHGGMNVHKVPLETMAKSVHASLIASGEITVT